MTAKRSAEVQNAFAILKKSKGKKTVSQAAAEAGVHHSALYRYPEYIQWKLNKGNAK